MAHKHDNFSDPDLGQLLSLLIFLLVLTVVFLGLSLPFSKNAAATGGAISALCILIGGIVAARSRNRSRNGGSDG